jgi:acyl-CoA hydrolase
MLKTTPRRADDSRTTMTEIVLPTHANALGNVFGGQILSWMDICAAICAQRHAGVVGVTAGVDDLSFEKPIKVGQIARLDARVTTTFNTSFEVKVMVHGEDPLAGESWVCVEAFLTFVGIDEQGRTVKAPPLLCETPEDEALKRDATERRRQRLERRSTRAHKA